MCSGHPRRNRHPLCRSAAATRRISYEVSSQLRPRLHEPAAGARFVRPGLDHAVSCLVWASQSAHSVPISFTRSSTFGNAARWASSWYRYPSLGRSPPASLSACCISLVEQGSWMSAVSQALTPEKIKAVGVLLCENLFNGPPELRQARCYSRRSPCPPSGIRITGAKSILARCASNQLGYAAPMVPCRVRSWRTMWSENYKLYTIDVEVGILGVKLY